MKLFYLPTLIIIAFWQIGFAQNIPNAVNFQAIARDGSGALVTNSQIEVQLTILDGGPAGTPLRQPRFIRNTDAYGQFSLTMSEDSATGFGPSGVTLIPNIDWSTGNKWVRIEFRPNLIAPFTNLGTVKCNSDFYAFSARTAEVLKTPGLAGQVLKHNGTDWVAGTDNGVAYTPGTGIDINGSNVISTIREYAIFEERYAYPGNSSPAIYGFGNSNSIPINTWTGTISQNYIPLTQTNNTSSNITISSGLITLAQGTYLIRSSTYNSVVMDPSTSLHFKSRIINSSNNLMVSEGSVSWFYRNAGSGEVGMTMSSFIDQVLTLSTTTTIKFQRYVSHANAVTVLSEGIDSFLNVNEDIVLSKLLIEKIN
jgi:hypothetical protein